jgi:hypothetical protein
VLKELHDHVVSELHQGARTDTVFVVVAVVFNLAVLGINWSVADVNDYRARDPEKDWILALMILATVAINAFVVRGLLAGKHTRETLISGLISMYRDNGVDKYYDATLLGTYATRYRLFIGVLVVLAAVAVVIPLAARVLGSA